MFIDHQPEDQLKYYTQLLKAVGSLSGLFSNSARPYIAYRATENLFCKAFQAENISRHDYSIDALKYNIGIGVKTFLHKNGKSNEKIAEFNKQHALFSSLESSEKIRKIAELRNERLFTTKSIFDLKEMIYHCVTRQAGKIVVYEIPMSPINLKTIKNVSTKGNSILFSDNLYDYSFNVAKSTLYKRFITPAQLLLEIEVNILADPFTQLEKIIKEAGLVFADIKPQPHVFLPLYSTKRDIKHVPKKSGLNQWNAGGRKRDLGEVYIPIPSWIHQKFPHFFPSRDQIFELILPNKKRLSASVCQDNSKALMSNPNVALGQWLLRDVLNLKEGELLTYEKLQAIGLDSVVIYRIDDHTYDIDFTQLDSYENFKVENSESKETEEQVT